MLIGMNPLKFSFLKLNKRRSKELISCELRPMITHWITSITEKWIIKKQKRKKKFGSNPFNNPAINLHSQFNLNYAMGITHCTACSHALSKKGEECFFFSMIHRTRGLEYQGKKKKKKKTEITLEREAKELTYSNSLTHKAPARNRNKNSGEFSRWHAIVSCQRCAGRLPLGRPGLPWSRWAYQCGPQFALLWCRSLAIRLHLLGNFSFFFTWLLYWCFYRWERWKLIDDEFKAHPDLELCVVGNYDEKLGER